MDIMFKLEKANLMIGVFLNYHSSSDYAQPCGEGGLERAGLCWSEAPYYQKSLILLIQKKHYCVIWFTVTSHYRYNLDILQESV